MKPTGSCSHGHAQALAEGLLDLAQQRAKHSQRQRGGVAGKGALHPGHLALQGLHHLQGWAGGACGPMTVPPSTQLSGR